MISDEQKEIRKTGIGGSDMPAIVGVDRWRQPLDIWLAKTGGYVPEEGSEASRWGNILEEVVAREWAERHDVRVWRDNRTIRHPDRRWQLAHVDRIVVGCNEGLEIKTRSAYRAHEYGPDGSEIIPVSDRVQCLHYIDVRDADRWHLAVLIGGQELRSYTIERDDELIVLMRAAGADFWSCVERRERPSIDYDHESTKELLSKLYPGTNGKTIHLSDRAAEIKAELDSVSKHLRHFEDRKSTLKNELADMMGEAAVGILPGGAGGYRRKRIDRKSYVVESKSYMDLRFSKNLKDN